MKRCLVIPGTFVPANEPMTLLVYKQLRLLPFMMDVCALKYWATDKDIENKLSADPYYKKFNVVFTDQYKNVLFSIRNINLFKGLRHMQKYIDDAAAMYSGQEYIYTSSFPCYTIRAGMTIKKINPDVKWIANFTDPINHSPYKVDDRRTFREYSLPEKIAFKLYCRYYVVDDDEKNALENADILLFICEEQREFMLEQYRRYYNNVDISEIRKKSVIVPLNYVPEWNDLEVQPSVQNSRFVLSHFGRVYGLRIIDEFLYALKMFNERHPECPVLFEQYGDFRKSDLKLIRKLGLQSCVAIHEKIPYSQCIQKMADSDAVLIFDTILPEDRIQPYLPSKVIEYSLLKKNTLSITTSTSPTYRISKESGAAACRYDRDDILKGLEEICIKRTKSVLDYSRTDQEALHDLLERIGEEDQRES